MIKQNNLLPVVVGAAILTVSLSLPAPIQARPEPGREFADWKIGCDAPAATPTGGSAAQTCFAFQSLAVPDGSQQVATLRIGFPGPKGDLTLIADLPLGIDLGAGVMVRPQPGEPIPITLRTCVATGCRASAALTAAATKALTSATTLTVSVLPFGASRPLAIPFSTKGLEAALAAVAK